MFQLSQASSHAIRAMGCLADPGCAMANPPRIDTRQCVGCHACTIACVAENKSPPDVVCRPVVAEESGGFPNVKLKALIVKVAVAGLGVPFRNSGN